MRALLRGPPKPRGEFPTLPGATVAGGIDAASWTQRVADAEKALASNDLDAATALYTQLYQDLAKTVQANLVPGIPDSFPVNRANGDDKTGLKPGLNLVLKRGGPTAGSTFWIDSAGTKLPDAPGLKPGDPEPSIATRLFSSSFTPDKLMALDTLRHEMVHAGYLQKTLEAIRAWRKAGSSAGNFESWLDRHRTDLTNSDVEVIKADARGGKASSEVLAYLEGFMTVFHLIDPPPDPTHAVFVELLGVLDATGVLAWTSAAKDVRAEATRRLERYYCEVLDSGHRRAFDAWLAAQAKRIADDDAVLKAKSASSDAKAVATQHKDFIGQLQKIPAKCPTRPAASGPGHAAAPTSGEAPADTAARHVGLLQGGKPGDEALVLSELRRLDKETLAKVDEAAAKLPKNSGERLRRKISFVRHAPADAVPGSDDLAITGGETKVDAQSVEGGTVTVTSKSDLSWSETFGAGRKVNQSLRNAVTFQYKGAGAPRSHWIQLIWREVIVTDADKHKTWLDRQDKNSAGISYRLTPKGGPPIIAVDRALTSEPWYEHGSPSHRDPGSLNVADVPDPHDGLFNEFLSGTKPARNVQSIAHLTTYLVRDDKIVCQVTTDVTWNWDRNTKPDSTGPAYRITGPVYDVKAKVQEALDKRDREALVRDFPDMDYLP